MEFFGIFYKLHFDHLLIGIAIGKIVEVCPIITRVEYRFCVDVSLIFFIFYFLFFFSALTLPPFVLGNITCYQNTQNEAVT